MGHPNSCVTYLARQFFGSTGRPSSEQASFRSMVRIEWNSKLNALKHFKSPTCLQPLVGTVAEKFYFDNWVICIKYMTYWYIDNIQYMIYLYVGNIQYMRYWVVRYIKTVMNDDDKLEPWVSSLLFPNGLRPTFIIPLRTENTKFVTAWIKVLFYIYSNVCKNRFIYFKLQGDYGTQASPKASYCM